MGRPALVGAKGLRFSSKYNGCIGLLLLAAFWAGASQCDIPKGIRFRADYYQRDLTTNTIHGKGNAWVKNGQQQIWADEIEADFQSNRAVASGHVKMQDGALTLWCSHANFNLAGSDALFENATLTINQMVITGNTIRRIDNQNIEVEEGTYSNCNTDLISSPEVGDCSLDWKIFGRRFRVTIGGYAHFYDLVVHAKNLPLAYSPYLILPTKSQRETGFLIPSFTSTATLGSGMTFPVFFALGPWHDLLAKITTFSTTGLHLALNYRYIYSEKNSGFANVYLVTRAFGNPDLPGVNNPSGPHLFGVFGEGAIRGHNIYHLSGRSHSRQIITWVSNPYYSYDYLTDVGPRADLGNLRSLVSFTQPGDTWLLAGQAQYLQSLVISRDSGVDGGAVTQLPQITAAKRNSSLLGQFLSYEFDSQFNFFYRRTAFDLVPASAVASGVNTDENPYFDSNDYLRTGRRLQLEPRLVANFPMPSGFQFQPVLKAGSLLYDFDMPPSPDFPSSTPLVHREYAEVEIPVALQASRTFKTSISGYESVNHVFQPRFIFASGLFQSPEPSHPFFYNDLTAPNPAPNPPGRSNPRFDIIDWLTPFQYMRFELINRFRRRSPQDGALQRFFWFQVSEQYNIVTSTTDPRYLTSLGPLEVFSSALMGSFSMQLSSTYSLQPATQFNGQAISPVRESSLSTGLSYRGYGKDVITLNALYRQSADPALQAQTANLYFFKGLPTFFDLDGYVEYNFLIQKLYSYRIGFYFRSYPRSCWSLSVSTGRNAYGNLFTTVGFSLDIGTMHGM